MSSSIYTYYVYAYIRSKDSTIAKAGTPYYIGKGKGRRMYHKHNVHLPKDNHYIIILESNLSNIGALALERRYVQWYGRVDNNTGILRNLTDGGEGSSGRKYKPLTDEHKLKLSKSLKGYVKSEETKQKLSKKRKKRGPLSEERKAQISKSMKGKNTGPREPLSEERKAQISKSMKGKNTGSRGPLSKETKQKLSKAKKGRSKSEETKKKMSEAASKGLFWITDGVISKRITKDEVIPEGWYKGRTKYW